MLEVHNDEGTLYLVSREAIPKSLVERSATLTALQQAPGHQATLPLKRCDFESWAQQYAPSQPRILITSSQDEVLAWAACVQRLHVTDFLADTDALGNAAAQLGEHLLALKGFDAAESERLQAAAMALPVQLQLAMCRQLCLRKSPDFLFQALPTWLLPSLAEEFCSPCSGGQRLQLGVPDSAEWQAARRKLAAAAAQNAPCVAAETVHVCVVPPLPLSRAAWQELAPQLSTFSIVDTDLRGQSLDSDCLALVLRSLRGLTALTSLQLSIHRASVLNLRMVAHALPCWPALRALSVHAQLDGFKTCADELASAAASLQHLTKLQLDNIAYKHCAPQSLPPLQHLHIDAHRPGWLQPVLSQLTHLNLLPPPELHCAGQYHRGASLELEALSSLMLLQELAISVPACHIQGIQTAAWQRLRSLRWEAWQFAAVAVRDVPAPPVASAANYGIRGLAQLARLAHLQVLIDADIAELPDYQGTFEPFCEALAQWTALSSISLGSLRDASAPVMQALAQAWASLPALTSIEIAVPPQSRMTPAMRDALAHATSLSAVRELSVHLHTPEDAVAMPWLRGMIDRAQQLTKLELNALLYSRCSGDEPGVPELMPTLTLRRLQTVHLGGLCITHLRITRLTLAALELTECVFEEDRHFLGLLQCLAPHCCLSVLRCRFGGRHALPPAAIPTLQKCCAFHFELSGDDDDYDSDDPQHLQLASIQSLLQDPQQPWHNLNHIQILLPRGFADDAVATCRYHCKTFNSTYKGARTCHVQQTGR